MKEQSVLEELRTELKKLVIENNLLDEKVSVSGKVLTTEEAIGNPERKDFPLMKGKEKLLQAKVKGKIGQAFTDMPGSFEGTLAEIINKPFKTHNDMAVFIATLNAVMNYLGLCEKTIHCKDNEPEECAQCLPKYIKEEYGNPKIALIGFQPSFLENLSKEFSVRVLDLDPDRLGTEKFGVKIEDGEKDLKDVLDWCDLIFSTGSTIANNTIKDFLNKDKPVIFFGTTISGAAHMLNLKRYCQCAK